MQIHSILLIGLIAPSFLSTQTSEFGPATATCQNAIGVPNSAARQVYGAEPDCNTWRGLTPLVSVRADVERLLGTPRRLISGHYSYESKTEKVHIVYSGTPCELTRAGRWNVPPDTVLELNVYPQTRVKVEDLNLDLLRYVRGEDGVIPEWVHYINLRDGIIVEASTSFKPEAVMSVEYRPNERQMKFRCSNASRKVEH